MRVSTELFKPFAPIHTQSVVIEGQEPHFPAPNTPPRASTPALEPPNIASASASAPANASPNVADQTASSEGPDGSANPSTANDDNGNNLGVATSSVPPANHEVPPNSTGLNVGSAEGEHDIQGTSNIEQQQPPYVDQAEMKAKKPSRKRKPKKTTAVPLVEATSTETALAGPMTVEAIPMSVTPAETAPPKNKGNRGTVTKRKADEAGLEPREGTRKSTRTRSGAPALQ